MRTNKFIVIEGIEGAGKSTATRAVEQVMAEFGIDQTKICRTREPGGTLLAEKLRSLVKDDYEGEFIDDNTELLLMYAARVQLISNVIKPALEQGKFVLGDRHDLSSCAYQGGGRQMGLDKIERIRSTVMGDFKPDFTIYMDIDPALGLTRARGRGQLDRIEKMDLSFFERTRDMYQTLIAQDPNAVTIDASKSIEEVTESVKLAMRQYLSTIL